MKHAVVAVLVVFSTLTALPVEAARKPNVILIVADDLGYADLGCQQQSRDVKTPNIDSIAANGVRFTNGYVSGPVCSPTRAGMLTGRYQQRFGFEWNPRGAVEEAAFGLPRDEITLPQQLKKAGYATGMFGKWHLGHQTGMLPHERGFDEFFGFAGGAHRYVNNATPEDNPNAIQRNGTPVGESEYLTDAFTREAVAFIERNHDQPFFVYLPYNAPHSPMQAPEKYLSRFPDVKDENRRAFLAMLSAVDDGVGAVLAKLRAHKLEENTLVIFISDNGGPTLGNGSLNTPLRGRKGDTLEGGVRVPFLIQWADRLPAGKVEDRMVIQLDLFPTILAAAGAESSAGVALDGKDLLPYLSGANDATIHETLYWRFGPRRGVRSGEWKLHWNGEQTPRLYNLSKDIGEANDLAAAHPDVAQRLRASWDAWDAQLMKPRWPGRLEGDGGETAGAADASKPAAPRNRRRPPPH
jgi:arylsulfatase A-like enzyme